MRILSLALFTLCCIAPRVTAQCTPFGPPCTSSGMQLICSSPPTIGTNWTIGERSAAACNLSSTTPGPLFTMLGGCFPGGIPIDPPLACTSCGGCSLSVLPSLGAILWTWPPRTHVIPIPADVGLIGATFCMQDACVNVTSNCVCISQATQVVIQ